MTEYEPASPQAGAVAGGTALFTQVQDKGRHCRQQAIRAQLDCARRVWQEWVEERFDRCCLG